MGIYLTGWRGSGFRHNPFRPDGADGNWSVIDLRPDSTVRDGYALLSTEADQKGAVKLGDGLHDTFGARIRNRVHNLLGVDISRVRRFDVLAATLMMRPNGWTPLRPTGDRYEIWLGSLVWEFPLIRGGASDDFNRANETPIAAPWTDVGLPGSLNLTTNAVRCPATSDSGIYYAAAASSADQFSQCSLGNVSSGTGGPCVRSSTAGNIYFIEVVSGSASEYGKMVGGGYSDLGAGGAGLTNPVRMEAEGTTLRVFANGVQIPNSKTDGSLVAGQPGIFLYANGATADDWSGDNLEPPPSADAVVAWIRA